MRRNAECSEFTVVLRNEQMKKLFCLFGVLSHKRNATSVEASLIALTFVCLPLFEAPKNLLSIFFVLVWISQSVRRRSLGEPCPFNAPILGLALILWIAPFFSSYSDPINVLNSAPRWTILAIFVMLVARLNYTRTQLWIVFSALMFGGVVAVVESFWVWHINGKPYPEFRSVGHVNHSSMYSLIPLAVGIAALYMRERWLCALGAIAILSTMAFLPPTRSIVGGIAIISVLSVGISIVAVSKWSWRGLFVSTACGAFVVMVALLTPPAEDFRTEFVALVTGDNVFSGRDKILNSALAVWDQHPILGAGWFSFGAATSEEAVRAALEADGVTYDPNLYWHFPHGHNLWTTMLIERGLAGIVFVNILLFLYFKTFLPIAFSREHLDPTDRGAAIAALLVVVGFVVAGLGNTTMMNEHGHAGMAVIAVSYGYLRGREILMHKLR